MLAAEFDANLASPQVPAGIVKQYVSVCTPFCWWTRFCNSRAGHACMASWVDHACRNMNMSVVELQERAQGILGAPCW